MVRVWLFCRLASEFDIFDPSDMNYVYFDWRSIRANYCWSKEAIKRFESGSDEKSVVPLILPKLVDERENSFDDIEVLY